MKRYVVDTHSIIWHLTQDRHLSRRVRKILDSADEGHAQILVPSAALTADPIIAASGLVDVIW